MTGLFLDIKRVLDGLKLPRDVQLKYVASILLSSFSDLKMFHLVTWRCYLLLFLFFFYPVGTIFPAVFPLFSPRPSSLLTSSSKQLLQSIRSNKRRETSEASDPESI